MRDKGWARPSAASATGMSNGARGRLGAQVDFLRDFFTPPAPCDLCRLGEGRWSSDRTGVVEWSLRGLGLNVVLRVCPGCAEVVTITGLREKTPLLAMVTLVQHGRALRPPVHAYFQHLQWRKVWMHTLERAGTGATDEFDALAQAKLVEAKFFDAVTEPSDEATRAELGVQFLRNYIRAAIRDSPEISYLRQVLPQSREALAKECSYLVLGLLWLTASVRLGDSAGRGLVKGVLMHPDRSKEDIEYALTYIDQALAESSALPNSLRANHLVTVALRTFPADHPNVERKLTDFAQHQWRELKGALDRYLSIAEPR